MGWFSRKNDFKQNVVSPDEEKRSDCLIDMCNEFNKNFKLGDFIKYWRGNHEDWDSSFGFITEHAVCQEAMGSKLVDDCWFCLMGFRLYNKANPDAYPEIIHIRENFHAKKATQEDFIEYKKAIIQSSIDSAKDNINRLKEHIRSQRAERNNINDLLKENWEIVTKTMKKYMKT